MPGRERCSSCGADERVEHQEIGSIEGTVPLCRGCAQRAAEAKERDRIAALPKRPALRLVVDNTRDPARVREQASRQPRRARRARGNLT